MLSYENALKILDQYGKEAAWTKHCLAVADLAAIISTALGEKAELDTEFLHSAALLHDIGRYVTHDPILHGVEGYKLLTELGYHREAFVCASHILYGLNRREAVQYGLPEKDFIPTSFEQKLIPLIDFLVEFDNPTTLKKRFSSLRKRNIGNVYFLTKLAEAELRATSFQREINEKFGILLEDIVNNQEGEKMSQQIKIMPCLDMQNGRVVKGVHFVDIKDAGNPEECAKAYCDAGADELALLDITATVEGRSTMLDVVKRVSEVTTVPFTVGGGIADVGSAEAVLSAGADKISTSSAAFRKPEVIAEMVKAFGADKVTVAIDVDQNAALPSGYEVYIDGGRTATGFDAIEWAKQIDGYGVPVILPTSKAGDGVRTGYDLPVIKAIKEAVSAEVVASGGAGKLEHFFDAVQAGASILLAASVFHFGIIGVGDVKDYLRSRGISVS